MQCLLTSEGNDDETGQHRRVGNQRIAIVFASKKGGKESLTRERSPAASDVKKRQPPEPSNQNNQK